MVLEATQRQFLQGNIGQSHWVEVLFLEELLREITSVLAGGCLRSVPMDGAKVRGANECAVILRSAVQTVASVLSAKVNDT